MLSSLLPVSYHVEILQRYQQLIIYLLLSSHSEVCQKATVFIQTICMCSCDSRVNYSYINHLFCKEEELKKHFEALFSSRYAFDEVYTLVYKPLYEAVIDHCHYFSRDSFIGNDSDTTLLSLLFEALHNVVSMLWFHHRLELSSEFQLSSLKHSLPMNPLSCHPRF